MNEIKESIEIVKFLRKELQHTDQFSSKLRSQWVIELNEMIKMLKAQDYVVEELPNKPKEKRSPAITLEQIKNNCN